MMNLRIDYFYKFFYTIFFIFCIKEVFLTFPNMDPPSFYYPNGILSWLDLSYSSLQHLTGILKWFLVANIFILIFLKKDSKFFTGLQVSALIFLVSSLGFRFSYNHFPQLEMFSVFILLSFIFFKKPSEQIEVALQTSSIIYFISGLAKLRYSGFEWLDSGTVHQIFQYSLRLRNTFIPSATLEAMPQWVWIFIGVTTLLFELLLPFLLLTHKYKKFLFFIILLFHTTIAMTAGIYSTSLLLVIYLFYVRAFCYLTSPTKG